MAPPKIWRCRGVQWLCPNRSESVKMGGNYFFLFAYDMEDTLMYFLVESCKEIRHKRSTTGNSKHMNAKHGKIGRITEVDVHIISVRISFFPKKQSTSTGCFFQVHTVPFTRCPLTQKPPICAPLHQWWDWWYCHVLPWKLAFGNKRTTWILQSDVKFVPF